MLVGATKSAFDKRSQYSIGLLSPVLCRHRYARLDTFAVTGTLLSAVKELRVTSLEFGSKFKKKKLFLNKTINSFCFREEEKNAAIKVSDKRHN